MKIVKSMFFIYSNSQFSCIVLFSFMLLNVVLSQEFNTCVCIFDSTNQVCRTSATGYNCNEADRESCPCSILDSQSDCEMNSGVRNCLTYDTVINSFCPCVAPPAGSSFRCYPSATDINGLQPCPDNRVCPCENTGANCDVFLQSSCYDITERRGIPSAVGDPHFTGFDGSRFDFHGMDSRFYLLFGEKKHEFLTAKMRATLELQYGVNKTYISDIGLQTKRAGNDLTSSHRVHVFIKDHLKSRKMYVTVNGKKVTSSCSFDSIKVIFLEKRDSIRIETLYNKYIVKGISLKSKARYHLDFSVLPESKNSRDDYSGVLGMTFGNKLLRSNKKIIYGKDKLQAEIFMRKHFQTQTLFLRNTEFKS